LATARLVIVTLEKELSADTTATAFEVVAGGLAGLGALLADYHDTKFRLAHDPAPEQMPLIERLHYELEADGGWC
jgi:ATP-binding cassette subfamily F protein uup